MCVICVRACVCILHGEGTKLSSISSYQVQRSSGSYTNFEWRITDSENTVYTVQEKKNIDDSVLSELLIAFVEQNKWILQLESERSSFISLFLTKALNAWTSLFSREREKGYLWNRTEDWAYSSSYFSYCKFCLGFVFLWYVITLKKKMKKKID